ncbi:MAG: hypothetical protein ACREQ5_24535 [Candidatus Dormibacteria bacterium]
MTDHGTIRWHGEDVPLLGWAHAGRIVLWVSLGVLVGLIFVALAALSYGFDAALDRAEHAHDGLRRHIDIVVRGAR